MSDFQHVYQIQYLYFNIAENKYRLNLYSMFQAKNKAAQKIDQKDQLIKDYSDRVEELIQSLNNISEVDYELQLPNILRQLLNNDQMLIKACQYVCLGQVLLTRHGKCKIWDQKKYGLNPNASLSKSAMNAMRNTKKFTHNLLLHPDKTLYIGVSPMVRAKQTACLIKPESCKSNTRIETILQQNSQKPSGRNIMYRFQLQQQYDRVEFLSRPIHVLTLKLSLTFFAHQQTFKKLHSLSSESDQFLIKNSLNGNDYYRNGVFNETSCKYQFKSKFVPYTQKTKQLLNLICQSQVECSDYWAFGHSGNFNYFLKHYLKITDKFSFGETRKIYKLKLQDQKWFLFHPPYKILINQEDGKIRAEFVRNQLRIIQHSNIKNK